LKRIQATTNAGALTQTCAPARGTNERKGEDVVRRCFDGKREREGERLALLKHLSNGLTFGNVNEWEGRDTNVIAQLRTRVGGYLWIWGGERQLGGLILIEGRGKWAI